MVVSIIILIFAYVKQLKTITMVTVYFETPNGSYAEKVAVFDTEELYMVCLPQLKIEAKKQRMIVTESVSEHDLLEMIIPQ